MRIEHWGDDLAIRLPADIVEQLGLKEGDELQPQVAADQSILLQRSRTREEALAILDSLARPFPPDFRFSRHEANER